METPEFPIQLQDFLLGLGKKYSLIPTSVQSFHEAFQNFPFFYPDVIKTREAKELEKIVETLDYLESL